MATLVDALCMLEKRISDRPINDADVREIAAALRALAEDVESLASKTTTEFGRVRKEIPDLRPTNLR
jgi:hypothetical protein